MSTFDGRLLEAARSGNLVIFAGAGLSAAPPAALPGWNPLNAEIVRALRARVEVGIGRPGWLEQVEQRLSQARLNSRFPPDFQAQVLEEVTGDRYFRALQALDVDGRAITTGHDAIAVLAKAGALRAVITTNFDRLIEQALKGRGVEYTTACDDRGFDIAGALLRTNAPGPLPIIKIHGCVSAHTSMIDTLKQRMKGRAAAAESCLQPLCDAYWLFVGFSAADLETKPDYLGLTRAGEVASGGTYIAYPGAPDLRPGAQVLMAAFGERGRVIVSDTGPAIAEICRELDLEAPRPADDSCKLGPGMVSERLADWAESLPVASAGLCLAAMSEAVGESEPAARILDRLVRHELLDQRDTEDFRLLQLHYGRLGAAWGRFFAVADINGAASNASVECMQSLLRILQSEVGFAASTWLVLLELWLNKGESAIRRALKLMEGVLEDHWEGPRPRSEEEAIDAWIAMAQVMFVNAHRSTLLAVVQSAPTMIQRSRLAGDVVRTARVAAFELLARAQGCEDITPVDETYTEDFDRARRVGDELGLGVRELALGMCIVRRCEGNREEAATLARRALGHFNAAYAAFQRQGTDAWVPLVFLKMALACVWLDEHETMQKLLDQSLRLTERFPVWLSHVLETAACAKEILNDESARETYAQAADAARESGLLHRHQSLADALA